MTEYLITYPDGSQNKVSATVHNGVLCHKITVQKGYKTIKRRTNPDPLDDYEPEYETVRVKNFEAEYIPFLNRTELENYSMFEAARELSRKAKGFADFAKLEKFMLRVGENPGGINIKEVTI